MSDYREKEWDEPGPDFGRVFVSPRPRRKRTPEEFRAAAKARKAANERLREIANDPANEIL